jgi:uncharacterized membrane protein
MIEFENKIVIQRPVEEVFAFVSDFENVPKWNYYVQQVTRTSNGPFGAGTIYHQVRKSDQQDFEIIDYKPGQQVTVKTLPGSRPVLERRLVFEAEGKVTKFIDRWQLESGRPRLLERLAAGRVRRAVLENLQKLKELLETGAVQLQDGRRVSL